MYSVIEQNIILQILSDVVYVKKFFTVIMVATARQHSAGQINTIVKLVSVR
jgi:hypothetical protein